MNRAEGLYLNWLLDLVVTKEERQKFSMVFEKLFDTEFISYNEFDDNFVENVRDMRENYNKRVKFTYDITVLELMVYIADKIESTIMTNDDFGDRTGLWFWYMMDSLDLIQYDNSRFNELEIEKKLDIFIERRYEKNGFGGLFTLEDRKIDARKTNIWQQAMSFVTNFAKSNGELF